VGGITRSEFGKPNRFQNTGFSHIEKANQTLQGKTQASFFSQQSHQLTDNVDALDKEQLKERLLVTEALLKKIYNKNKELEDDNNNKPLGLKPSFVQNEQTEDDDQKENNYLKLLSQGKEREEELTKEI